MKWIKYKFCPLDSLADNDESNIGNILIEKMIGYSDSNILIAEKEAYNSEYSIEDDGIEKIVEPTQLDIIEAQVAYTAMMTDTLLEV